MSELKKVSKIVYIGLRLYGGEKLYPCFLERGKHVYFRKVKWCEIGDVYEITDGTIPTRPESLGVHPKATDEQIEQWSLEEEVAKTKAEKIRAAKKVDKLNLWDKPVADIHDMVQKLGHFDREELAYRIVKLIVWGKPK